MKTYNDTNIANLGETTLYIRHKGINHKVKFQISRNGNITLLECNPSQWHGYVKFLNNSNIKTVPPIRSKQEIGIVEVDFLWNRTVDSLKTNFHPLLWTSSGLKE